ncbi:hypothetical protein A6A03_06010 [Chloroflexus islandicus]|uniref:Rax2-like C-terminal domain-containing protein n=1 Tax=Chloroflexus islandicus TaxID=1707952 RepID=A0A178LSC5_9CHLR|nr:hypothetical protein [Chloroflexus islandicus]OAN36303.1 hypothetical protein A6A03_06010 [Chloroflexus islandicus]
MSSVLRYVALLTVLTLTLAGMPLALPVAAAAMPVAPLLTADGALRADALAPGALDLTGWNVTLDPARGPVFRPATLASTTGWEHLGSGIDGALNDEVNAIAIDSTGRVYVGGAFTDVAGIATADHVAMWNPATQTWSALGSNGNGNGALNGDVKALAIDSNGRVFVGGSFTNAAGIATADYIARWNPTTQTWSALGSNGSGNGALNGDVTALTIASNSRVYVGGLFTNAAGISGANWVVVWNPISQTWSRLGTVNGGVLMGDAIQALAVDNSGRVYVGGWFFNWHNIAAADYIVMWNPVTQTWNALGSNGSGDGALNDRVHALVVDTSGKVYVGGRFTDAADLAEADYVARWDPSTLTWSALGSDGSGDGALGIAVFTLAIDTSGRLYAGGGIDGGWFVVDGSMAMWNPATQTWTALGSDGSSIVTIPWSGIDTLAIDSNGRIYIGGRFKDVAGLFNADNIAMWSSADQTWSALGDGPDGALDDSVYALAIAPDGKVYVGGWFEDAAGIPEADNIAMWDPATQQWNALGSNGNGDGAIAGVRSSVFSLAIAPEGKVYVGGAFDDVAGIPEADNVAIWDPVNEQWSALGSNGSGDGALSNTVYALAIAPDGKVYAGGSFTNAAENAAADYVAVWDPVTEQWGALGSNGSGDGAVGQGSDYPRVYALAIDANGRVYVGGDFINVAGIAAADYVAMWNPSTQRWSALGSNSSGDGVISGEYVDVSALAIDANGRVYVGGTFDNLAGIAAADSVAVWNPATGRWSALGNGLQSEYSYVAALAVDAKERVYIGGIFSDGGGIAAADALVVWDPIT